MFFLSQNVLSKMASRKSMHSLATGKENDDCREIKFRLLSPQPIIYIREILKNIITAEDQKILAIVHDGHDFALACIMLTKEEKEKLNYSIDKCNIQNGSVMLINSYSLVEASEKVMNFISNDKNRAAYKSKYNELVNVELDDKNRYQMNNSETVKPIMLINLTSFNLIGQYQFKQNDRINESNETNKEQLNDTSAELSGISKLSSNLVKITDLNPLVTVAQNKSLRMCCTNISTPREFTNRATGNKGRTMRVQFYDTTSYIELVFFNEFCDRYPADFFKNGTIYIIRKVDVKNSKKTIRAWHPEKNSSYDLHFNINTEILIDQDQSPIEKNFANCVPIGDKPPKNTFITLNELQVKDPNCILKTIGIVVGLGELDRIERPNKTPLELRRIEIVDQTTAGQKVRLALWGKQAVDHDFKLGNIYYFLNVQLTTYGGRSLSMLRTSGRLDVTTMKDIEPVEELRLWWENHWNEFLIKNQSTGELAETTKRKIFTMIGESSKRFKS